MRKEMKENIRRYKVKNNYHVGFNTMCWPSICSEWDELVNKLTWHKDLITDKDKMMCASIITAYKAIVLKSQVRRNDICKNIKELSTGE